MNEDNQISVIIKDGGFIEFDERNGKALCRQILAVNVEQMGNSWIAKVHPLHDRTASFNFSFCTKSKANEFLELLYEASIDLDRMHAGLQTDQIVKVRTFTYV